MARHKHSLFEEATRPATCRFWPARALRACCRSRRLLCLTYDDGPSAALSREVMHLLRDHNAHATFFALGKKAEALPEVLDEAVAAGHQVACHTSSHLNAWKVGAQAVDDICAGYHQLARWVPLDGLFRPPYGKMNSGTKREIRRRQAKVAWWTIDSGDTWDVLPKVEHASHALAQDGGGVVLLHDFDRTAQPHDRSRFVIESTRLLLDTAQQLGIRAVRFDELFVTCPGGSA